MFQPTAVKAKKDLYLMIWTFFLNKILIYKWRNLRRMKNFNIFLLEKLYMEKS